MESEVNLNKRTQFGGRMKDECGMMNEGKEQTNPIGGSDEQEQTSPILLQLVGGPLVARKGRILGATNRMNKQTQFPAVFEIGGSKEVPFCHLLDTFRFNVKSVQPQGRPRVAAIVGDRSRAVVNFFFAACGFAGARKVPALAKPRAAKPLNQR